FLKKNVEKFVATRGHDPSERLNQSGTFNKLTRQLGLFDPNRGLVVRTGEPQERGALQTKETIVDGILLSLGDALAAQVHGSRIGKGRVDAHIVQYVNQAGTSSHRQHGWPLVLAL